jgi:hypothetical protein
MRRGHGVTYSHARLWWDSLAIPTSDPAASVMTRIPWASVLNCIDNDGHFILDGCNLSDHFWKTAKRIELLASFGDTSCREATFRRSHSVARWMASAREDDKAISLLLACVGILRELKRLSSDKYYETLVRLVNSAWDTDTYATFEKSTAWFTSAGPSSNTPTSLLARLSRCPCPNTPWRMAALVAFAPLELSHRAIRQFPHARDATGRAFVRVATVRGVEALSVIRDNGEWPTSFGWQKLEGTLERVWDVTTPLGAACLESQFLSKHANTEPDSSLLGTVAILLVEGKFSLLQRVIEGARGRGGVRELLSEAPRVFGSHLRVPASRMLELC